MRIRPLLVAVASLLGAVIFVCATPIGAWATPAVPVQQLGGGEDSDRPTNVGGLVIGIGLVVAWGVILAEVLRRAAARRAAAAPVDDTGHGRRDPASSPSPDAGHTGDARSRAAPP